MELHEKVLEASQRTLESQHPVTLYPMNDIAIFCSDLGNKQEAIRKFLSF